MSDYYGPERRSNGMHEILAHFDAAIAAQTAHFDSKIEEQRRHTDSRMASLETTLEPIAKAYSATTLFGRFVRWAIGLLASAVVVYGAIHSFIGAK